MSKDFFKLMGDQLYGLKNSPFMRLGAKKPEDGGHEDLSYDPERLFRPDKHRENIDQTYIDFKKDEKGKLEKIEFDLLRKQANQEYQKLVEKNELLKKQVHSHPYTIFKNYRSLCQLCNSCGEYEGNFSHGLNLKNHQGRVIQYMQCNRCGCPMNSHFAVTSSNPFNDKVWKHLRTREIKDEYLNNKYYLIALRYPQAKNHNARSCIELLKRLGLDVRDSQDMSKLQFELGMIRSSILKDGIEKGYVESLLHLVEYIGLQQHWDWSTSTLPINEELEEQYDMLRQIANNLRILIPQDDRVILLLVQGGDCSETLKYLSGLDGRMDPLKLIWGSKTRRESLIFAQQFFTAYFKVNSKVFFLPSCPELEFKRNSSRFKDILDYNGYVLMMENARNVEKAKVEKAFKNSSYSKLNYILGQEVLNDRVSRIGIKLTARLGPHNLSVPFPDGIDYISIPSKDTFQVVKQLYPEFLQAQRCVIILRPFVINLNFEEAIVNLFRVNNFILLKRIKVKLDEEQARYMAVLECIPADQVEDYVDFMTSGVCEIILVSKRSAIYEAYVLANGCLDSVSTMPNKLLKEKPTISYKKGSEVFEYELPPHSTPPQSIFSGIRDTVSIENIMFGYFGRTKYGLQTSTGGLVTIEDEKSEKGIQLGHRVKETMLAELNKDHFNYWAFTSKSDTITEELAGIFLPECTLFESTVVILKPGCCHLVDLVRKSLMDHRYHIITEKSVILTSKPLVTELIFNLQKIKQTREVLKDLIHTYSTEKVHLFCISKTAAKREMVAMLSDFAFTANKSIVVDQHLGDEDLRSVLLPVWNNEELCLRVLSQPLGHIEKAVKDVNTQSYSPKEKLGILQYLVGSYFGVGLEDLSMKTSIGKLSYYHSQSFTAKLQSWFYAQTSYQHPNYVPLLFQYRQFGSTTFCIQSDHGVAFMTKIVDQYESEREKLQSFQHFKQKSLVLYLWSKKLSQLVKDLCSKTTTMKGYGDISYKNGEFRGCNTGAERVSSQKEFLEHCLKKFHSDKEISQNINKMLSSRVLGERYKESEKRLIPSFGLHSIDEGMRIIETDHVSKIVLMDEYQTLDPQNEQSKEINLYSYCLYNVVPEISTKYALMSELYFFLLKWEVEGLEYNKLFKEMSEHYHDFLLDLPDLEMLEMEIYLKYLRAYFSGDDWVKTLLHQYPVLRGGNQRQDKQGKKRKFLPTKQYFKSLNQQVEENKGHFFKEYTEFDLRKNEQPQKANEIYNPDDPLHYHLMNQPAKITLLRDTQASAGKHKGIYVEYEKKISENEELVMDKINNQVDKFNLEQKEEILYETGLEKDLWYRKTKKEMVKTKESQLEEAIDKQINKFFQHKKTATER